MTSTHNPTLEILPGAHHPAPRVLRISYDLICEPRDHVVGLAEAKRDIDDRRHLYEQMVGVDRSARFGDVDDDTHGDRGDA